MVLFIHLGILKKENLKKQKGWISKGKNIEEEIRQFKLYKIQVVEAQMRKYRELYEEIKEGIVIKFTKNASSNLLRLLLGILSLGFGILGVLLFFPEIISRLFILESQGGSFFNITFFETAGHYIGFFMLFVSLIILALALLLKKNIRKRNKIYELSNLVTEVIDYMDKNVKDDKMKYEYFVDSAAEFDAASKKKAKLEEEESKTE